ncbi:MAG TPA: hypothetical protein PLE92_05855 [Lentisphaeria bacterium]|nr:hypothetical protein [Lentisphaeria bacterium]
MMLGNGRSGAAAVGPAAGADGCGSVAHRPPQPTSSATPPHASRRWARAGHAATPHIICINAAENSVNNEIAEFPAGLVYKMGVPGSQVRVMTGLTERFTKAYQSNILPAELGACSWARLGKIVDTTSYDVFCG